MNNLYNQQGGFTLTELMVAVSMFLIIMTISVGSILNITNANRKSRSTQTALNNLNSVLEAMTRDIRFGTNYHCGLAGNITSPEDCLAGDTAITVLTSANETVTYHHDTSGGCNCIKQTLGGYGVGTSMQVTSPQVSVDSLVFYTLGSSSSDTNQPRVIVKVAGHAGTSTNRTDFILQTLVSQRKLDI